MSCRLGQGSKPLSTCLSGRLRGDLSVPALVVTAIALKYQILPHVVSAVSVWTLSLNYVLRTLDIFDPQLVAQWMKRLLI